MFQKIIFLIFISIAVQPVFSSLACDGVFSACMATIKVPSVCWTARLTCIAACGEAGPLCHEYGNINAVAQWVCGGGSSQVLTCSQNDQKILSKVIDWCQSSEAKRYGVISFPGWFC